MDNERLRALQLARSGQLKQAVALGTSRPCALQAEDVKEVLVRHDKDVQILPGMMTALTDKVSLTRWLMLVNPELGRYLDDRIGTTWRENPQRLELLEAYTEEEGAQYELTMIKALKKKQVTERLTVNPETMFDVCVCPDEKAVRYVLKRAEQTDKVTFFMPESVRKEFPESTRVVFFDESLEEALVAAADVSVDFTNAGALLVNGAVMMTSADSHLWDVCDKASMFRVTDLNYALVRHRAERAYRKRQAWAIRMVRSLSHAGAFALDIRDLEAWL